MRKIAAKALSKLRGQGGIGHTFRGFSWLLADKLTSLFAALLVSIPIARHLGPADFGVLVFVSSYVAILLPISSVGLENIVTRYLVERPDRQGAIMGTVLLIRKLAGVIVLALFALFCAVGPFPSSDLALFTFLTVTAAIVGNASIFRNWFVANHQLRNFAIANTSKTIAFGTFKILLVYLDAKVWAFIATSALELGLAGGMAWLAYSLSRKTKHEFSVDPSLARELIYKAWPLAVSGIAAALYLKIDIILLTSLASPHEAGLYAAAARLSEIWYFVPSLLMTAVFPSFLKVRSSGASQYNHLLQNMLDALSSIGTVLALIVTLSASTIVPLIFGQDFSHSATILTIHIWAGIFIFMRAVLSKWLIAEDLYLFSLVTHGSGAIANIILNLWLIPIYGGVGAAFSTLISYSASSYLSLAFSPKTRPMFVKMSLALLWPRRLPELYRLLRAP